MDAAEIATHAAQVDWFDAALLAIGNGGASESDEESDAMFDGYAALRPRLRVIYEALMGHPFEDDAPIDAVFQAIFMAGWDAAAEFGEPEA